MVRVPRWLRDTLAVIATALVATALILAPPLDRFHGVSIDVLTWLRWRFYERSHPAPESRTVVVALDEETYRTPPFAGTPAITWTRQIGQVLTAVLDGGATVVGFDIVFPTSIEQSEIPFGDGSLGARLRGFDRDFLRAGARGARRQGGTRRGAASRFSDHAVAGPAHRGRTGRQYPLVERLQRSRRHRAADSAARRHRSPIDTLDGGRARGARAWRHSRHAVGLPDSKPGRQHDGAQFPRWRRCDSHLLVGRSLRLHRERRSRILPPALQWQGRARRHAARCRGSPGHLEAVCHDAGNPIAR